MTMYPASKYHLFIVDGPVECSWYEVTGERFMQVNIKIAQLFEPIPHWVTPYYHAPSKAIISIASIDKRLDLCDENTRRRIDEMISKMTIEMASQSVRVIPNQRLKV